MAQELRQTQDLRLQQRLAPLQVRFARLLEMNAQEAEAAIQRELEDNPALERADEPSVSLDENGTPFAESSQQLQRADYGRGEDVPLLPSGRRDEDMARPQIADDALSLLDTLEAQAAERQLTADQRRLVLYIIGNIDPNGYLTRSPRQMIDDLAFGPGIEVTDAEMQQALDVVRSMDPAGIGATSLQQSLLLQLERLPESQRRDDALSIIRDAFEAFTMKQSHRIISRLKIPQKRVGEAVALIRTLNPKPGAVIGGGTADVAPPVIPDFAVEVLSPDEITVSLTGRQPHLQVEAGFEQAVAQMQAGARARRGGDEFVTSRYDDARDFIGLVQQRSKTLMAVITAIVDYQKQYFITGDEHDLRPMGLRQIADMTGYDLSTVSRSTAGKYVTTPMGILPLRHFFSEGLDAGGAEGDTVSAREVHARMAALIDGEDKRRPLSDEALCQALAKEGYNLSRRTIAKYRDRLGYPVARLRRHL